MSSGMCGTIFQLMDPSSTTPGEQLCGCASGPESQQENRGRGAVPYFTPSSPAAAYKHNIMMYSKPTKLLAVALPHPCTTAFLPPSFAGHGSKSSSNGSSSRCDFESDPRNTHAQPHLSQAQGAEGRGVSQTRAQEADLPWGALQLQSPCKCWTTSCHN